MFFNDTAQIPSFVKTDQRIQIRKGHTNTHTYNTRMCIYIYTCVYYTQRVWRVHKRTFPRKLKRLKIFIHLEILSKT